MTKRFTFASTARIAYIAMLAIVWHALMPLAHAASLNQSALSSICTSAPTGQPNAPTVDLLKQCPLCVAGAHFAVSAKPPTAFTPDAALSHVQSSRLSLTGTHVLVWLHFSARAPPQA